MKHGHRLLIVGLGVVALAVVLVLLAPWGQDPVAANGTIHHVDADADGANNGSSWGDAFTELQPALDAAIAGDQIWVAAGTYTPTAEHGGTGDRYRSFQMVNGVSLYGGFDPGAGDDTWEERDWAGNAAILSGDLDGDDGPDFENNDENSYHVLYHPDAITLDNTAILDGFTITGGNSAGEDGGGMYNSWFSSPTLANCTFVGNSARAGGGMYNHWSSPTLTSCTFSGNSAGSDGGGMFNFGSVPALTNCTFSGNSAGVYGGGMVNAAGSSSTLTNCTFYGNSANWGGGGGMHSSSSSSTLTNCILWGDTAGGLPSEITYDGSTPVVTYSDVQGGYPGEGNIDIYPFFVDPDNGDFHLGPCSPCIDAGDNDAPDLPAYDFEGDDRIVDGDGDGTPIVDMGVDEVVDGLPCLHVYLPLVLRGY